jgi:hypothetical protein
MKIEAIAHTLVTDAPYTHLGRADADEARPLDIARFDTETVPLEEQLTIANDYLNATAWRLELVRTYVETARGAGSIARKRMRFRELQGYVKDARNYRRRVENAIARKKAEQDAQAAT